MIKDLTCQLVDDFGLRGNDYCKKKKSVKLGLGLLDGSHLFFEMFL